MALSLVLVIKQLGGKKPKQTETPNGILFEAENIKIVVPTRCELTTTIEQNQLERVPNVTTKSCKSLMSKTHTDLRSVRAERSDLLKIHGFLQLFNVIARSKA